MENRQLAAAGSTPWIQLGQFDNRIEIRTPSWSSTTAALEYSIDGTTARLSKLAAPTENSVYDLEGPGYVRLTAGGTVNTVIEILVASKARKSA